MTNTNPTLTIGDEILAPESYPTFWDAIPVDTTTAENTPHPVPDIPQEDAHAAFLSQTQEGGVATLNVEQTDVG